MSCGGRVYKGDTISISVPFDISGYTNLTISYFTVGDYKIVKTQEEVEIEDGAITCDFSGHDLDLLPDGVIRYTINYDVDNTDYVESTNTMLYLKTPASYSAVTPQDIWMSGYTSGQEDCPACSGGSGCVLTEGHFDLMEGFGGCVTVNPDESDGFSNFQICDLQYGQSKYNSGYTAGYADGQAQPAECSGYSFFITGSVIFRRDIVMSDRFGIVIIYDGPGSAYGLSEGYIYVDGRNISSFIAYGETISAGTHSFYACLDQDLRYEDFSVSYPIATISGSSTNDVYFQVSFGFSKYPR